MPMLICTFVVTNHRRQFFSRSPIYHERLESKMRNLIFVKYDITQTELIFAQFHQKHLQCALDTPRDILLVTVFFIIQPEASSTIRAPQRALVSVIIALLNDSVRSLNKNGCAQ